MRTFNILVDGKSGQVALDVPKSPGGTFTGTITSPDGNGKIVGTLEVDGTLRGKVSFAGHNPDFVAKIDGNAISGRVVIALFLGYDFTGTEVA